MQISCHCKYCLIQLWSSASRCQITHLVGELVGCVQSFNQYFKFKPVPLKAFSSIVKLIEQGLLMLENFGLLLVIFNIRFPFCELHSFCLKSDLCDFCGSGTLVLLVIQVQLCYVAPSWFEMFFPLTTLHEHDSPHLSDQLQFNHVFSFFIYSIHIKDFCAEKLQVCVVGLTGSHWDLLCDFSLLQILCSPHVAC